MNLLDTAAEMFQKKMGSQASNLNTETVANALQGLLPTKDGELDIAGLVAKFSQDGGLQSIVNSWIGMGDNESISAEQIKNILGNANVSEFASKLGLGADTAANGLSETIPQLVDKLGGSSLGSTVMNAAKGILDKLV